MIPQYVHSGEPIEARQINAIIDALQNLAELSVVGHAKTGLSRLAAPCVNGDAEVDILAGEPVYINTGSSVYNVNTPILSVIPYDGTHDEYPVGVARFDMQSEEGGQVILSGLAVVKVASITTGAYLQPTSDGEFEFTAQATAFRYIGTVTQADDTSSTTKVLAFIGAGSGGGTLALGAITQRPAGGAGAAVYQKIVLDGNGLWTLDGNDVAVDIPAY